MSRWKKLIKVYLHRKCERVIDHGVVTMKLNANNRFDLETCRAVSGYFGNGARAFQIGKNSVVLDRIGKNFNKLKKSVLSFAFRYISGKWT